MVAVLPITLTRLEPLLALRVSAPNPPFRVPPPEPAIRLALPLPAVSTLATVSPIRLSAPRGVPMTRWMLLKTTPNEGLPLA